MTQPKPVIQKTTSNVSTIAKEYRIGLETFYGWVDINPALKELLQPYFDSNKRTLPPDVVRKIYDILGEP